MAVTDLTIRFHSEPRPVFRQPVDFLGQASKVLRRITSNQNEV